MPGGRAAVKHSARSSVFLLEFTAGGDMLSRGEGARSRRAFLNTVVMGLFGMSGRWRITGFAAYAALAGAACALALAYGAPERLAWPLAGLDQLSATLGEVRGRTLHTGVDVRTGGLNGHPVYAPAAGAVVRVMSKPGGYGNALFLAHDGVESVYGHLDSFGEGKARLNTFIGILKLLYNSDDIDFRFDKVRPVFDRKQVVAYTGESGSGPPHLHYELRSREGYLNPLAFHELRDTEPPIIERLFVCVEENGATVSERAIGVRRGWRGYTPDEAAVSCPPGARVFLKISCYDRVNSPNRVAVHRLGLLEGDSGVFSVRFDLIRYSDLRYGHMVYDISKSTIDGSVTYTYFLCKRDGNGFSGIGPDGDGYIVPGRDPRRFRVVAADAAGNSSVVEIVIKGDATPVDSHGWLKVRRGEQAALTAPGGAVTVRLGRGSLRTPSALRLAAISPKDALAVRGLGALRENDILAAAALYPFDLQFDVPADISIQGPRRADVMIYHFYEGRPPRPLPTTYSASRREYGARGVSGGYYALLRDTVAPVIGLPPTHEFMVDDGPYRKLRLEAYDGLSRLRESSVECVFDGERIPCVYDNDRRWVEMVLPLSAFDGGYRHVFLRCSDNAGNTAVFSSPLR